MSRSFACSCLFALTAAAVVLQAQERHVHSTDPRALHLGTVHFPNSGNKAAQEPFLRGLALLHSFEYEEAAEQFRLAQTADKSFAMAFWGDALTHIHPLWGEDDSEGARAALQRLASSRDARLAKAGTPRERAYGAAVEALFAVDSLPNRARAFAESMRQVTKSYPNDPEAVAFTSLALMFVGYAGELPPDQLQIVRNDAVTLAERVFKENPEHPGGAHYVIHATDDPQLASRGLTAARRYAEIAPDAEHALHMPSHIFLQLGMWRDVVASNERAWAASRAEIAARKLSNAELSFHALQWLQYGYLQAGRYDDARRTVDTGRQVLSGVDVANAAASDARYAVGFLQFRYAADTGEWSGDVCSLSMPAPAARVGESDRERSFRAQAAYQAAIAMTMCGTGASAIAEATKRVEAGPANDPTVRFLSLAVRHAQLLSVIRGETATNLDALLADAPPSRPLVGPPGTLRGEELVGEARLKRGRAQSAVAVYEQALQLTPNRTAALLGLARARRAAGDVAGAADAYGRLRDIWREADTRVPALREVRDGAATVGQSSTGVRH